MLKTFLTGRPGVIRFIRSMSSSVNDTSQWKSIEYAVDKSKKVANIQFNRPHAYNAIDENTPGELKAAVEMANLDDEVKVSFKHLANEFWVI